MIALVKEIFFLLTPSQRRRLIVLQLLVTCMAFAELVGVASIGPFMALVADIELLTGDSWFATVYEKTGLQNPYDFLFVAGLTVLTVLALATGISMFTIWRLSVFAAKVGAEIADRLYRHYLNQDWLFHSGGSSAELTKKISTESTRVTDQIIQPLMQINARLVLVLVLSSAVLIYNPVAAATALIFFVSGYVLLYKVVRGNLERNGKNISRVMTNRFLLMNEGFGGIKDVLLLNRSHDFVQKFEANGSSLARSQGTVVALSQAPRYFMEFLAFSVSIGLILILIRMHSGDLAAVLPALAIYALAGLKLLPALQQIYAFMAVIKGNISAFHSIKQDLIASQEAPSAYTNKAAPKSVFRLERGISLNEVWFTYPGKSLPALSGISLTIPSNKTIGIVGPSGSGKSTVIDLLMGLIHADRGDVLVDGQKITVDNKRGWQDLIGYVPQSIYLTEGTIAENVAFGISLAEIDRERVKEALKLAHLDSYVDNLEAGLDTKVGERGVQLSGGQRQRIGIARALYYDVPLLVLDEATSALDGLTEKFIMSALRDFRGRKTVVMIAHRLKTVQDCDIIYYVDQGKVQGHGTFSELMRDNIGFREMAAHS